jgi:Ca-activated chloride channel family protein
VLSDLGLLFGACAPPEVSHNNRGNERFAEGAYSEALDEYRLAQMADPDLAVPYYNAANSHNRRSELSAVVSLAIQALRTASPELAADVWFNTANAFFDAEQWFEAVAGYREALRLRPDDRDAKHNLELAQRRLEEQQERDKDQPEQQDASEKPPIPDSSPPTPTSAASPEQPSENQKQPTPEPGDETQTPDQMGREQAEQLLEALIGSGETLQERLQKNLQVPATQPKKDW